MKTKTILAIYVLGAIGVLLVSSEHGTSVAAAFAVGIGVLIGAYSYTTERAAQRRIGGMDPLTRLEYHLGKR